MNTSSRKSSTKEPSASEKLAADRIRTAFHKYRKRKNAIRSHSQNISNFAYASMCTELARMSSQFLDDEIQKKVSDLNQSQRGGLHKSASVQNMPEYYRRIGKPFFEKLLMQILWNQPADLLGYVQQQLHTMQFKVEIKGFLERCDAVSVQIEGEEKEAEEKEEEQDEDEENEDDRKMRKSMSRHSPLSKRRSSLSTMNFDRVSQCIGSGDMSKDKVSEMFEQAFLKAGGYEALEEGRRIYRIEERIEPFTGLAKRPRQNKEYDVLTMPEFLHEAAQKNFRFQTILAALTKQIGGTHEERPVKSLERSGMKNALKHGTGARNLLDVVSSAIWFPDVLSLYDGFSQMLAIDRRDFRIVKVRDRIVKPAKTGFRDLKIFIDCDEFICELHLYLAPVAEVKNKVKKSRLQKVAAELLLFSLMRNYETDAQRLLDLKADPNLKVDLHSRSCLHHAASQNKHRLVQSLIQQRANPVCTDNEGAMPFQRPLQKGHYKVADELLVCTENCYSSLNEQGHFQIKEILAWWIDVMRYDKKMRNSFSQKILEHLAKIGRELIPVLDSALFPIILQGDLDMIQRLLRAKAEINAQKNGIAVLDAALDSDAARAVGMVQWLVQRGAVSVHERQWKQPELFDAAKQWDLNAVTRLWEQGVNLGCEDANGCTVMDLLLKDTRVPIISRPVVGEKAIALRWVKDGIARYSGEAEWRANNLPESALVLDTDAEGLKVRFDFDQEEQRIPYEHVPDHSKQLKILTWLGEHGARANQRWLHSEIMVGAKAKVQFLLGIHADVHLKDKYQRTPLHVAAMYGQDSICQWLLDLNACVDQTDQLHQTPLFGAKTVAVARLLLEARADLHTRDQFQNTIVHAASSGELVGFLASRKASLESRNAWGEVPLHHAARGGKLQAVVRLLSLRATPDVVDHNNHTPLHVATDQNTACSLVESGISQKSIISAIDFLQGPATDFSVREHEREQVTNIVSWLRSLVQAGDGRCSDVRKLVEDGRRHNGGIQRSESTPDLREKRKLLISTNKADFQSQRRNIKGHWSEKDVRERIEARSKVVFDELHQDRIKINLTTSLNNTAANEISGRLLPRSGTSGLI